MRVLLKRQKRHVKVSLDTPVGLSFRFKRRKERKKYEGIVYLAIEGRGGLRLASPDPMIGARGIHGKCVAETIALNKKKKQEKADDVWKGSSLPAGNETCNNYKRRAVMPHDSHHNVWCLTSTYIKRIELRRTKRKGLQYVLIMPIRLAN